MAFILVKSLWRMKTALFAYRMGEIMMVVKFRKEVGF
jgi:hypothetical protein